MTHYQITIQPSGRQFTASAEGTILEAAIEAGIGLPYSCRDGACGSCKCQLIEGQVSLMNYQAKALSEVERAKGLILTCQSKPLSDVVLESRQVTAENAFPIKKMPTRVTRLQRLTEDVMQITLQLPANDAFLFHAGQYLEFILRDGSRRSYSMATAPSQLGMPPCIELHIRHMPKGLFTSQVFSTLKERDILRIEGPFGGFYLRSGDAPVILLASGTGFAPIQAMLQHMQQQGETRSVTLYWGGRRPQDVYAMQAMQALHETASWFTFVPVISEALPEDHWTGRTGFVHLAVLEDHPDLSQHHVYACGAPVVVAAAQRDFVQQGHLPEDAFWADAFTSMADKG